MFPALPKVESILEPLIYISPIFQHYYLTKFGSMRPRQMNLFQYFQNEGGGNLIHKIGIL